jgi:hypothetical protein
MGSINPQRGTQGGANIVGGGIGEAPWPDVMAAATLDGTKVTSSDGEHVGKISDIIFERRRALALLRSVDDSLGISKSDREPVSYRSGLVGLLQQHKCAVTRRFCLQCRRRICTGQDGGRGLSLGAKALMHLDTRHPGHADVGNQARGMGGLPGCKKFFCRLIHARVPAKRPDEAA